MVASCAVWAPPPCMAGWKRQDRRWIVEIWINSWYRLGLQSEDGMRRKRHCNNCPRGNCPRRQLSKGLLSKGQLSKETFVQGRLLSKWQFSKGTFFQGRLLSKKTNTYIFVQGTFVTEMKKKNWKLLGTKKTNTNFLLLFLKCRVRPTYGFLYPLPLADLVQNYFQ